MTSRSEFADLSETESRYLPKLRDLPVRKLIWSLACLFAACCLFALFFYIKDVDPYSPEVHLLPEVLYDIGTVVFFAALAFLVASVVMAVQFKNAWMHRRIGLALLRYLDDKLHIGPGYPFNWTGGKDPPYGDLGWLGWIDRAKLLTELGMYNEALDSRIAAKQVDLRDMKEKAGGSGIPDARKYHDEDIAVYKVVLRLHQEGQSVSDINHEDFLTLLREEQRRPDPHGFDRDRDGIGCESG